MDDHTASIMGTMNQQNNHDCCWPVSSALFRRGDIRNIMNTTTTTNYNIINNNKINNNSLNDKIKCKQQHLDKNTIRGRHLVACCSIEKGRLLFVERPLLALQSCDNRTQQNVQVCYNCKSFIGNADYALSLLVQGHNNNNNNNNNKTKDQQKKQQKQQQNDDNTNDNTISNYVPCRYNCGYIYCSTNCEQDSWYAHHYMLCTGPITDINHPLIQYKQYAIETNEILLLIAEWWISEHTYKYYQQQQQKQQNKDELNQIQVHDDDDDTTTTTNNNINPYNDFVMNPWWDVVASDVRNSNNSSQSGKITFIDHEIITLQRTIHQICNEASKLLSNSIEQIQQDEHQQQLRQRHHQYNNTIKQYDDKDDSNVQKSSSSMNTTTTTTTTNDNNLIIVIPPITPHDVSIRIGACEQNAMGIRQRHPLCRDILIDRDLRQRRNNDIIYCLKEAGFIASDDDDNENSNEGEEDDNDIDITNDDDDKIISNNNNSQEGDDNVEEKPHERENVEKIVEHEENASSISTKDAVLNDGLDDRFNYTPDEIASFLSELHIEEGYRDVKDTAIGWNDSTDNDANNNTKSIVDESGDDMDYLFPPLDGTAMYSIACKMNHSCDPNVILLYRKKPGWGYQNPLTAFCIAIKDIQEGDELTISYIESNQSYSERQRALANYGFICNCNKCQQEKCTLSSTPSKEVIDMKMNLAENNNKEDDPFGSEDESMSDDIQNEEDVKLEEDDGETKLQKRIERLETIANHSSFGCIPLKYIAPVSAFVLQTGKLTISDILNNKCEKDEIVCTLTIKILNQCIQALEDKDYSMCKIIGNELSGTLYAMLQSHKTWPHICYRHAFWCSTLTACIGYAHDSDFLRASFSLDKGIILGLSSDDVRINPFISYVEIHAKEMAIGPYPPYFTSIIPCYNTPHAESIINKTGLSNAITYPVEVITSMHSLEDIPAEFIAKSKSLVIRKYASEWPAVFKWRDLNYFAYEHGHRMVPIEIGSMIDKAGMKEELLSFRTFIEDYLIPSTSKFCWTLDDSVNNYSRVAYLAQHPLLTQITSLRQDLNLRPSLCGTNGPSVINLWMGTGGTRTPLHYDSSDNLLVQLVGVKYIRLYNHCATMNLYISKESTYGLQGNLSDIDCEREHCDRKHPHANELAFSEVVLFPGDCLFLPARTWHYVRSLSTSISVNYWF